MIEKSSNSNSMFQGQLLTKNTIKKEKMTLKNI